MLAIKLTILACLSVLAAARITRSTLKVDVACPGVNNELRCPKGSTIAVRFMNHGSQSNKICAARHKVAWTTRLNCVKPAMMDWVKQICDKNERCRLPKPNAQMFIPNCVDPKNQFIQIHYVCPKNTEDVYTAVACEGQVAQMKCEQGCIKVVKAYFGRRDQTTCTRTPTKMTFCTSPTAAGYVRKTCNGKKDCNVKADAKTLGKAYHCDALPKYLNVDYVCQKRCN